MQKSATLIPVQKHDTVDEAAKALEKRIFEFFDVHQKDTTEESSDADDLSKSGVRCA